MRKTRMRRFNVLVITALAGSALLVLFRWGEHDGAGEPPSRHEQASQDSRRSLRSSDGVSDVSSGAARSRKEQPEPSLTRSEAQSKVEDLLYYDYCDDSGLNKILTTQQLIDAVRANPANHARVTATEMQLRLVCANYDRNVGPRFPRSEDSIEGVVGESPSIRQLTADLERISEETHNEVYSADQAPLREYVREALGRPTSLFEFIETTRMLQDAGLLRWSIGNNTILNIANTEVAGILAGCTLFGGCDVDSPFSLALCFLSCEAPMGVLESARWSVAPREWEATEQLAAAIVALRRGG